MTLKITLTVDQDAGAELVGLLAKAYGRGELGIDDLRIERPGERVATLHPVPAKTIAKLAAAAPKRRHKSKGLRGNGVVIALRLVAKGQPYANRELKEEYAKHGLAGDGAGATLSKLNERGYIRRIVTGHYALTSKGEARLREIENDKKVEHNDRQND